MNKKYDNNQGSTTQMRRRTNSKKLKEILEQEENTLSFDTEGVIISLLK